MIIIEPFKAYSRKDIADFLEMTDTQLKEAEDKKLVIFLMEKCMVCISFSF